MAQFTISISDADADTIGKALGKLPLEDSMGIWLSLKTQISAQQRAQAPVPPMPTPPIEAPALTPSEVEPNGCNSTDEQAG